MGSRSRSAPEERDGMEIRVLVAEDEYLAREGIARALDMVGDVRIVATCPDLESARATVAESAPDVVLADIRMPPNQSDEGLQLAADLRREHPRVAVLLLSQHADPLYAMELFDQGSDRRGYLLKERLASRHELELAIRQVAEGGSYVDSSVVTQLLERRSARVDRLTPRELTVLRMVASGASNAAIAADEGITKRAVERHINSIFAKLGLADDPNTNRRVKATLIFLAGAQGPGRPPESPPGAGP
jgi:DNA-binding NarL/FixJ family response regulator